MSCQVCFSRDGFSVRVVVCNDGLTGKEQFQSASDDLIEAFDNLIGSFRLPGYRYVTPDDPLLLEQALSDPRFLLDSLGEPTIIDGIQYAPGLLSYVKMIVESNRDRRGIFVFTGSHQFAIIRNLRETLAGRIAPINNIPENMTGEIINGELVVTPRPSRNHDYSTTAAGAVLLPPYQFGQGGGLGEWVII